MSSSSAFPSFESATSIAAIDFETASNRPDSAVSVGVAHCAGQHPWQAFYSLIRPKRTSDQFLSVHGISSQTQKTAPNFGVIWPSIAASLGKRPVLLAHNAAFDRRVLRVMLATNHLPSPSLRFFCTMLFARKLWPGLPCDLHSVARRLRVAIGQPHHALDDALLVAEVAIRLREFTKSTTW